MGFYGTWASFYFSELVKIGPKASSRPSDQFPRGLRLLYFHSFSKWRKKALKLGLFGTRASFNFLELLKMGPNESSGPSDQFPRGLRLLYFDTLTKWRKKALKMGLFGTWASFNCLELLKIAPNEPPERSDKFLWALRLLYFHTLTKWQKKNLKMGLFGPLQVLTFWNC